MRNDWVRRNKWIYFVAPLAMAAFIWLFGEAVMHLWNWLLPALFGWRPITFWQTLGLVVLCRILFGSWGSSADRSNRRRLREVHWERMTPEEREKFRQGMRGRCGGVGAPAGETGGQA
jgi:hypothetical protein